MAMSSTMLYPTAPYPTDDQIRQTVSQAVQPAVVEESIESFSEEHELTFCQQPLRARVAGTKDKERKPIDPPPIIQLHVRDDCEESNNFLQSPYYFMCCSLYSAADGEEPSPIVPAGALTGTLVSSLHRLKDHNNRDGGFFVFGDLSVRVEGQFRLMFDLFELKGANRNHAIHIKTLSSNPFKVLAPKNFPGMAESTLMSKSFADQGVKLRIRKEPRTLFRSTKRQYNHSDQYHHTSAVEQSRSPKRQAIGHSGPNHQHIPIYTNHPTLQTGYIGQQMHAGHPSQASPSNPVPQFMGNGLIPAPWYLGR
ncbi:conserved hypothetical protein [Microsporum canis CBS 113480]|uniref:Velvet domain-containing protein n=1 Tax=Arthroderma otae (strain ATCC MYA-4605 / CBS 113480) TaxID=554155 RepID=C5FUI1_ARTOC|nr:conserved hypothetical protein [Microsporum canis CBS 113480]EEQ33565.1 conserved hypothetical protein [Microsporum canis CBS 113480]